ncbi:hypothetical protein, partial [Nonomuraea sp. NPDC059022]|uniref:hypothetical protein n=1 Tax=Nonomuraea sp. NPDC059022 TaxID=3346705 RepID=UPI003698DC08
MFAYRDDVGTVEIKSRAEVDEPNGVTVTVPVSDVSEMRRAAAKLFAIWEPGTVEVNGKAPTYLPGTMLRINDQLYARFSIRERTDAFAGLSIVMGGIAYPVTPEMLVMAQRKCGPQAGEILRGLASPQSNRLDLLAFVPVGDVDITPSREDLRDTPRTIAAIARAVEDFHAQRHAAAQREVDAEPTPLEAKNRILALATFLPPVNAKTGAAWRGKRLPETIYPNFPEILLMPGTTVNRTRFDEAPSVTIYTDLADTLVITNVDAKGQKTVRRLANRYMTRHGLRRLYLAPDAEGEVDWLPYGPDAPLPSMTFDEWHEEAKQLPKVSVRREIQYTVLTDGKTEELPASERREWIDAGMRLYLRDSAYGNYMDQLILDAIGTDGMLVKLTGSQTEDAFFKRFKAAVTASAAVEKYAQSVIDNLTDTERLA